MGLVSYTNLEDGQQASANDINQRFGDVLAQVNGNLDASNISNGSLTRELFTNDALTAAWPIGSVYMSVNDTNPGSLIGGSWVRIANGRMLVGVDESDTDFNDSEKTGGSKALQQHNHTASTSAAGNHSHSGSTNGAGNHNHHYTAAYSSAWSHRHQGIGNAAEAPNPYTAMTKPQTDHAGHHAHSFTTNTKGNHTHSVTINNAGTGNSGNMSPYFTVYMFRRIS